MPPLLIGLLPSCWRALEPGFYLSNVTNAQIEDVGVECIFSQPQGLCSRADKARNANSMLMDGRQAVAIAGQRSAV